MNDAGAAPHVGLDRQIAEWPTSAVNFPLPIAPAARTPYPMITRHHTHEDTTSWAQFSDCEAYRYALERRWGPGRGVAFVMLNPSTADERRNDPTIARCERRARDWGYDALRIVNLFAFRATLPADLRRADDPFGPDNASALSAAEDWADMLLAAWGVHGALQGAGPDYAARVGRPMMHLGLTQAGHPRHPLYVSYATRPVLWTPRQSDGPG